MKSIVVRLLCPNIILSILPKDLRVEGEQLQEEIALDRTFVGKKKKKKSTGSMDL